MEADPNMTSMVPAFKAYAVCWENIISSCNMDSEQGMPNCVRAVQAQ